MEQNKRSKTTEKSLKKFRNSIIASFLFFVIAIAIFSAQTYAYFWDTRMSSSNTIIPGNVDIEILEVNESNEPQNAVLSPISYMPGSKIEKSVKVKNTGSLSVYVRIKIEKKVLNEENNLPDGWEELITCDFNLDDDSTPDIIENPWIYRDGYYYYHIEVDPQSITASLFDAVLFSETMGNEFANQKIEFKIICQTVQANGNSDNPLDATGWPGEQ